MGKRRDAWLISQGMNPKQRQMVEDLIKHGPSTPGNIAKKRRVQPRAACGFGKMLYRMAHQWPHIISYEKLGPSVHAYRVRENVKPIEGC